MLVKNDEHDIDLVPGRTAMLDDISQLQDGVLYYFSLKRVNLVTMLKGHSYVEHQLNSIVRDLQKAFKGSGQVYRIASMEYGLLYFEGTEDSLGIVRMIHNIVNAHIQDIAVDVSTGVITLCEQDELPEEILRKAYVAMKLNQLTGGTALYNVYDAVAWEPCKRRIILEQDLLNAVKRGEIYVAYQPIVHPSTNKIGFEALARWNSPIHGHIPPAEFILMAEKMDIIQEITYFIIETVSTLLRDIPQIDYIAVNLSAKLFEEPEWYDRINRVFKQEDKQRIHFELTESCLINRSQHHHLKMLQQEGHKIFIDDFGTGYSSMEYLIELSINGIKLDRFFSNYAGRIQYKKFITKTVEMAKSLNLSVVIEGIENSFQKSFFTQLGCDGIQGYFESKPMTPEAIPLYLNSKLVKLSTL